MEGDTILLTDWSWIALDYLPRRRDPRPVAVWVFCSRRRARRARRTYGRGAARSMEVVFVG